jgi:myosin V
VTELLRTKVEEATKAVRAEFESERVHHQKLVKEYGRLQQRFENLNNTVQFQMPGGSAVPRHSRTPSNVSILSTESESNGDKADSVSFEIC